MRLSGTSHVVRVVRTGPMRAFTALGSIPICRSLRPVSWLSSCRFIEENQASFLREWDVRFND